MPLPSDSSGGSSDTDDGIDYGAYLETHEELDTQPLWPSSASVSKEAMREALASVDLIAHGPRTVRRCVCVRWGLPCSCTSAPILNFVCADKSAA
jgi:hypothetical protein